MRHDSVVRRPSTMGPLSRGILTQLDRVPRPETRHQVFLVLLLALRAPDSHPPGEIPLWDGHRNCPEKAWRRRSPSVSAASSVGIGQGCTKSIYILDVFECKPATFVPEDAKGPLEDSEEALHY